MGLNHLSIAAVIALLGAAAPVLHAETAAPPETTAADTSAAAPAPTDDPALKASPIAGPQTESQPQQSVASPETAAPAKTKGDVLTMPKKDAAAKKKKAAAPTAPVNLVEDGMPGRGASMAQVEKHFGAPREKLAPVGKPPITRWIYPDYTVYFEYEYVIHSVKNKDSVESAAPAQPAAAEPVAPAETTPAESPEMQQPPAPSVPETTAPPADSNEAAPASGQ